jgi:hypothetical protein
MITTTLHLMTQRDQPYGSERRCCERCGLMMVSRPDSFWAAHTWTDKPDHYRAWPAGTANVPSELVTCEQAANRIPAPTGSAPEAG